MRTLFLAFLALAVLGATAPARAETIDFIPDIGLDVGKGFDSLSAEVKRVPFKERRARDLPGGQSVDHDLRQVESVVQLEEALDVSASGSYGVGLFKVSAKASYMKSHGMDQYSLYTLVSCKVKNRESELETMELSNDAKALLNEPNGLELFHKAYGDRFVAGIAYGGEYHGILRIETKSEQDKQNISASLNASGFGWSASGNVQHSIATFSKDHSLSVKNIMIGGAGLKPPVSVAEMIKMGQDFPGIVQRQGYPVKVILSDYSVFPEYQKKLTDVETAAKLVMKDIAFNYMDYQEMRNDIAFIISNPDQFRFASDAHRKQLIQDLKAKQRDIEKIMQSLEDAKNNIVDKRLSPKSFDELKIQAAELYGSRLYLPPRYRSYASDSTFTPAPRNCFPIAYKPKGQSVRRVTDGVYVKAGDSEMKGHRPHIRVTASAAPVDGGKKLQTRINVTMQEDRADWTTFSSDYTDIVLDITHTQKDLRIAAVFPDKGSVIAQAGKDDHKAHDYPGTGMLAKAAGTTSDSKGSEKGDVGVRQLFFNKLTLRYAHTEDLGREKYELEQYYPTPAYAKTPTPRSVGGVAVRVVRPKVTLSQVSRSKKILAGTGKNVNFWFKGMVKAKPMLLKRLQTRPVFVPVPLRPGVRPVKAPTARKTTGR